MTSENAFLTYFYKFTKTRIHVSIVFGMILYFIIDAFTDDVNRYTPVVAAFSIWNFALYLFDRVFDNKLDALNFEQEAIDEQYKNRLLILTVLLALVPMAVLHFGGFSVLPYLIFLPITFGYNLRIFGKDRAIKHFFLLKNLYSSVFIWSLPVVVILKFYVGLPDHFLEIYRWFWTIVFAVTMGEIIWDMRDMIGDEQEGLKTVPVTLGLNRTKLLLFAALFFIYTPLTIWQGYFDPIFVAIFVVFIALASPTTPKWFYHLPIFFGIFMYSYKLIVRYL